MKGLLFWDVAADGERCIVDCFPVDDEDCPDRRVIAGVISADGIFRSEDAEPFNPSSCIWRCERHSRDRRSRVLHQPLDRPDHCEPGAYPRTWKRLTNVEAATPAQVEEVKV